MFSGPLVYLSLDGCSGFRFALASGLLSVASCSERLDEHYISIRAEYDWPANRAWHRDAEDFQELIDKATKLVHARRLESDEAA